MRIEVVAVGTELLLGQIVDTNSAWLGGQLALAGVDCHYQQSVGDNLDRIVLAFRTALARSEGIIVCGGLGPTHDDITREAMAAITGVPLIRDEVIVERIRGFFSSRNREMPESNARQADRPEGSSPIDQALGTAPGLICPVGNKVVYALPGVPYELEEMFTRAVLPDLRRRQLAAGDGGIIVSRVLKTWGTSESGLGELLAPRIEALQGRGNPTIALLASGIEGIKVRITAKGADAEEAGALLAAEEAEVRSLVADILFGLDDETMETAVAARLLAGDLTLGLAESLTGGLVASRLVAVPGASTWFRGSLVTYATAVKQDLLGLPPGPVVSEAAALAMAAAARRLLGSDVGLALTGVAGPDDQDGEPPGTVLVGLDLPGRDPEAIRLTLPGDRDRVRQYAAISALDLLRRRLPTP